MNRRVGLWLFLGLGVACCWVIGGMLVEPTYNLGRSTLAAIIAPPSLLGRRMALGAGSFILLNGAFYAVGGVLFELLKLRRAGR